MKKKLPISVPYVGLKEAIAVGWTVASKRLVQGKKVEALENQIGRAFGSSFSAVAVNSGTSALHILLLAHGIGKGDEVIVPSFTFAATANAVALTGATPVFADIELVSFGLDIESVRAAITPKTRAVLIVHLFGLPAINSLSLAELCAKNSFLFLEDCAQSPLAMVGDDLVGTLGDGAALSMYATKNFTSGEGGIILVRPNSQTEKNARLLRNQGMIEKYQNELVGLNNRLTDFAASMAIVQFSKLRKANFRRRKIAERYSRVLSKYVRTPAEPDGLHHVYHQYTLSFSNERERNSCREYLASRGIASEVYYPVPVHLLPSFRRGNSHLPNSLRAAHTVLSIPIYPSLRKWHQDSVIRAISDWSRSW